MSRVEWIESKIARKGGNKSSITFLNRQEAQNAACFHKSFEQYAPTPLRDLHNLANELGVSGVYVKDESYRFGLNAFKVLGGTYAMGKYLAGRLNMDIKDLTYEKLRSKELKDKLGEITFTTATDGNHGRGVAWTAQQLQQKAVVYMPKGSAQRRLENIRATGAEAYITDFNYDEAVRLAASNAEKYGWVIVQDTAWEGYEDIPAWIMQGYTTMAKEALEQLNEIGVERPTHIFVQADVGSLAGAIQGFFASVFSEKRPITSIVEPDKADCIFKSAKANDGKPRIVTGDMDTIMAGLACGEPNTIGWNILRDYSDAFISCPDYIAAKGMRILGNPLGDDQRVVSGESGAVTTGLLSIIMRDNSLKELKDTLKLDSSSRILLFSTEGDTDPENYRAIVWDGKYPSF
jgi:diaminopropionate ammonia-lyase